MFGFATIISAVVGLFSCLVIMLNEKFNGKKGNVHANIFLMNERRTMSFYRIFSRIYDIVNIHFYSDEMRTQATELAEIKESGNVLDVGCGTGYTTEAIIKASKYGNVVGADITVQQLKKAEKKLRHKYIETNLIISDVLNLPFRDNSFDAVVSVGAIEYFPDPDKAIDEMSRSLKTDSSILVGGPEYTWFKKISLDRSFYTPSVQSVVQIFKNSRLKEVKHVLTGVDTFFNTDKYVFFVVGKKNNNWIDN